jgi:hypothetical protein
MNLESSALDVQQAPRTTQIMQKMTINVQEIRILADPRDNMLVPYFGQQRTARFSQGTPPFGFLRPAARAANRRFARLVSYELEGSHQSMTDSHPARAYAMDEVRAVSLGPVPKRYVMR